MGRAGPLLLLGWRRKVTVLSQDLILTAPCALPQPFDLVGHSVALVEVVLQAMAGRTTDRATVRLVLRWQGCRNGTNDDGHDRIYTEETELTAVTAWSHSETPIRPLDRSSSSCWRRTLGFVVSIFFYRVFHQLADISLVDFNLGCSALCLFLLRQMGFWQKWQLGKMVEHSKSKSTQPKFAS